MPRTPTVIAIVTALSTLSTLANATPTQRPEVVAENPSAGSTPPKLLSGPDAIYPEAARRIGYTGVVVIEAVVDEAGAVVEARVVKGLGKFGMDEAALEAVLKRVYTPGVLENRPVEVISTITTTHNKMHRRGTKRSLKRSSKSRMPIPIMSTPATIASPMPRPASRNERGIKIGRKVPNVGNPIRLRKIATRSAASGMTKITWSAVWVATGRR